MKEKKFTPEEIARAYVRLILSDTTEDVEFLSEHYNKIARHPNIVGYWGFIDDNGKLVKPRPTADFVVGGTHIEGIIASNTIALVRNEDDPYSCDELIGLWIRKSDIGYIDRSEWDVYNVGKYYIELTLRAS